MLKKRGDRFHPEHELVLMMQGDPFFCSACRQIGVGSAYGCESCLVLVHKRCMYPPSTVSHPLQKNCNLEYTPQAENSRTGCPDHLTHLVLTETSDPCTFCGACSNPLRTSTYSSGDSGNPSFHPSCLQLEKCINVNDVKLDLATSCSSACDWCEKKSIYQNSEKKSFYHKKVEIPSWWYVSEGAKNRYHVRCVSEMMLASWKSGGIPYDEDADDSQTSMGVDKPGQRKGKRRGFVMRTAVRVSFVAGVSAVTGDPTGITGIVLLKVGSNFLGRSRFL